MHMDTVHVSSGPALASLDNPTGEHSINYVKLHTNQNKFLPREAQCRDHLWWWWWWWWYIVVAIYIARVAS